MCVRRACGDRLLGAAVMLLTAVGFATEARAAQPEEQAKLFPAYLQAGEFAPAVALARQSPIRNSATPG